MAQPVYFLFKRYTVEVKKWLQAIFHLPRLDNTGVNINIVYATPERAIAQYVAPLRNKATDIPIVGFYLANIAYQLEKNTAVENLETIYDKDNSIVKRMKPFQVYQISYTINIWTRLQMDMDIVLYQLLSQFTPLRWLAVDSSIDYRSYDLTQRHSSINPYPTMNAVPEQGKRQDADGNWIKIGGQWFPLMVESIADTSNLEPGDAGDRLIRTDITLTCDRAFLPIGGFEYKSIQDSDITVYPMTQADFEYFMANDKNWLSEVYSLSDLPIENKVGDIRRVQNETGDYTAGEPYIWTAIDKAFNRGSVTDILDLPNNQDGDVAYVVQEADYFQWTQTMGHVDDENYLATWTGKWDWNRLESFTGSFDITVQTVGDFPAGNKNGDIFYVTGTSYYQWNASLSLWEVYSRWIKYKEYLGDVIL